MLAPNPTTAPPTTIRFAPDRYVSMDECAPAELQPYGHRIALALAVEEIKRHMDDAAALFGNGGCECYFGDVSFPTIADAARFIIGAGMTPLGERAARRQIRRVIHSGRPYCGKQWRAGGIAGPYHRDGRTVGIVRVADGRRWDQIKQAAAELEGEFGGDIRNIQERLRKAIRFGRKAYGSHWTQANTPEAEGRDPTPAPAEVGSGR